MRKCPSELWAQISSEDDDNAPIKRLDKFQAIASEPLDLDTNYVYGSAWYR